MRAHGGRKRISFRAIRRRILIGKTMIDKLVDAGGEQLVGGDLPLQGRGFILTSAPAHGLGNNQRLS